MRRYRGVWRMSILVVLVLYIEALDTGCTMQYLRLASLHWDRYFTVLQQRGKT
jgi:hypothetical protein